MKNDFYNGIIVGVVQTLTGHPFDTLKVLQQTNVNIIYKNLSIRGLYRGMSYPMYGSGIFNSMQFGIYQYFNKIINNSILAGLGAGFISGLMLSPIEVLKIKGQVTGKHNVNLFRGMHLTSLRESLSTAVYFSTYYKCMSYSKNKSSFDSFMGGGMAGVLSWFFIYPIDVVKTRIQSYECNSVRSALRMGGLWKGLTFCLTRGFIVNGSGFMAYNYLVSE